MPSFARSTFSRAIRWRCLGYALACPPAWAQPSAPAAAGSAEAIDLDTLVVTTGKRNRGVREVAGSVSAIGDEPLQPIGAQRLADDIQRTPGVVFNSYQPGVSHVVMRGIATSAGNVQGQNTSGFFPGEIPLTEPGWTMVAADVDAFDLNRVEVLRGPQGTLFGSASRGGTVDYIAHWRV